MEGQKTEADYQKQRSDQEPKKEEDILFSCSGLSVRGDKEGLWSMECYEENNDQEVDKGRLVISLIMKLLPIITDETQRGKILSPLWGLVFFRKNKEDFFMLHQFYKKFRVALVTLLVFGLILSPNTTKAANNFPNPVLKIHVGL